MNDNTKTMLALFAGLAVGATLGIILAPEKGSELRDKLGDSLKKTSDDLLDKFSESVVTVKGKLNKRVDEFTDGEHAV
jgi:gas vesicle protein